MKIALVCPYSMSVPGGVQHQVLGLAGELRLLGHDVDVIAPCDGAPPAGVVVAGRSLRFRVNGSVASMAPTPVAARRVLSLLASGGYDVVHLHEPLAPSITIPALASSAAPLVGTFHAAGDRTPYRWFGPPLRRLARRLDARVAVSEPARQLAERYLGGTYETLPNGIDPLPYRSTAPTPTGERMVLFLGRHEPRKGLGVLLEAFTSLPDDAALWVCGDGPATSSLRRRFAHDGRIRWLGRVSDTEKLGHLRAASIVCVPATQGESFGMVLLEAMAAGAPIVASDLPAHRAVTRGRAAVLVPPGDAAALAAGLKRVLHDPLLAAELRAAGTTRVEDFGLDALARRYAGIYERVSEPLSRVS